MFLIMKNLTLLIITLLFSIGSFCQTQREKNNRNSGLNSINILKDKSFVNSPSISTKYFLNNVNQNYLKGNGYDGIKIYFGCISPGNPQIVLLFCKSGSNGDSHQRITTQGKLKRRSIDHPALYYSLNTNSVWQPISTSNFIQYKNNYKSNYNNNAVDGYFIGKTDLNFTKNNNNIFIKIGQKNNQKIDSTKTETINFHYLVFGQSTPKSSAFTPKYTTYFGYDVEESVRSKFGLNTDEINTVNTIDFTKVSLKQGDEAAATRTGGSKPCPPFGCNE